MKLTDLQPRWLNEHMFVFRCPHCRTKWLSCKSVAMGNREQIDVLRAALLYPTGPHYGAVTTKNETAWNISGRDFETMTVTPSIDASPSGCWHGFIKNGEIV